MPALWMIIKDSPAVDGQRKMSAVIFLYTFCLISLDLGMFFCLRVFGLIIMVSDFVYGFLGFIRWT